MDPFQSKFFYLLRFHFLGFRYHGWQKQPGVKTVQSMIEKTVQFVLGPDAKFKTLGASRTDAMVSARDFPMELFLFQEIDNSFIEELNKNLPADIHALSIEQVDSEFNVIQDVVSKEYHYQFTFDSVKNPFQAHLITHIHGELDIDAMQSAASLFIGEHNFSGFSYPYVNENKIREVKSCQIEFDGESGTYILKVVSSGFMRYQIRLMMGTLIEIGKGNLDSQLIKNSLLNESTISFNNKAPASGLILHRVNY